MDANRNGTKLTDPFRTDVLKEFTHEVEASDPKVHVCPFQSLITHTACHATAGVHGPVAVMC